jgi:putative transposase
MKKSKFSEQKIVSILKQGEDGVKVPDLCREHGISTATFYKWRSIWWHERFPAEADERVGS